MAGSQLNETVPSEIAVPLPKIDTFNRSDFERYIRKFAVPDKESDMSKWAQNQIIQFYSNTEREAGVGVGNCTAIPAYFYLEQAVEVGLNVYN